MKQTRLKKSLQYIVFVIIFILSLSYFYPTSISSFNGDSNQYYSWIKDYYTGYGDYLSWTTAAGYNQFSIIHIFSFIIGSITYKSPTIFFLIANYAEILLLTYAAILFIRLTNKNFSAIWLYSLPLLVSLWALIYTLANQPAPQTVIIFASDLYLIFVDAFIIISIGWFLFILNKINNNENVSKLQLLLFTLYQLYFSLTTLRFLSNAILTEVFLLLCILTKTYWSSKSFSKTLSRKINRNNKKVTSRQETQPQISSKFIKKPHLVILSILAVTFIVGYYGFFMLEPYSTSARFVLRGGETSTTQALNNSITALQQFLSISELGFLNILLRITYIIVLFYGIYLLIKILLPNKQTNTSLATKQLFGILTAINFILVTCAGLFSHGTVFLDTGAISHYYELSVIFCFFTIATSILEYCNNFKYIKIASVSGLLIISIAAFSIIFTKRTIEFPSKNLCECITANKVRYNLRNGMGDFWVVNPLMAQSNSMRFSVIGSMSTNLDFNWQRNLTSGVDNTNFLVYSNNDYKNNVLGLISSKIPHIAYQNISCDENNGIIVFDDETSKYINKFRNTEFNNAKSWFYLSNYGTGQTLWSKMPWNKQFIQEHHEYFYYGSLLRRIAPVPYSVDDNLAISVNGSSLPQPQPVLMSEMIHSGSGNYFVKVNYSLTGSDANIVAVNLATQQVITGITLNQAEHDKQFEFKLDTTTPIGIAVVIAPASVYTLNNLTVGKEL